MDQLSLDSLHLSKNVLQLQANAIFFGATTIKIEQNLKIRFVDAEFTNRVRKIQVSETNLLVEFLCNEIAEGGVVITRKRTDGKLDIIATNDIANLLKTGELSLKSKKGKSKEIGDITVVDLSFFHAFLANLAKPIDKNKNDPLAVSEVEPILNKTRRISVPRTELFSHTPSTPVPATDNASHAQEAELLVAQEEARMIDQIRQKNEELNEKKREIVRRLVADYELKRSILKQSILTSEISRQTIRRAATVS